MTSTQIQKNLQKIIAKKLLFSFAECLKSTQQAFLLTHRIFAVKSKIDARQTVGMLIKQQQKKHTAAVKAEESR